MKYLLLAALVAVPAAAQPREAPGVPPAPSLPGLHDPVARIAAQREAMQALSFLDGIWRGEAHRDGAPAGIVQTERVGPLLGGSVRVVEGRGYDGRGETVFNALGIISYDPVRRSYAMRSYAMGYVGDFPLAVRPDGFSWSQPAGPGATIRYTATVSDGEWHEAGDRVVEGSPPVRIFEMRLRRIGPADWPQTGTVPPRQN